MSDFNVNDRVRTTTSLGPIATGTLGTVVDASGISLIVRFDGDSSPGRLTPRNAVTKVSSVPSVTFGAAKKASAKKASAKKAGAKKAAAKTAAAKNGGAKKPVIFWGKARITRAAGPSAAKTAISNTIGNQVVILFDDAIVDLQTSGPLAGVWAGTITFELQEPVAKDTRLKLALRGSIRKEGPSSAVAMFGLNGEIHSKTFKKEGDFNWSLTQTLAKGATTHSITLLLAAERRTIADLVMLALDAIDIAAG